MIDCYKILGVRNNATLSEIKKAYREKVKLLHPDITGDSTQNEQFNNVVQAYRVLADARQRSIFDEFYFTKHRKGGSQKSSFDYYKWLSERQDFESRAKFIFFTLNIFVPLVLGLVIYLFCYL